MQKQLIKQGQGFNSSVYICTAGYQAIGYGHKLLPHQKGKLNYVTQNQAEAILDQDISKAKNDAQFWFGKQTLDEIGAIRKAVLVDMSFNIGCLSKLPKLKQAVQKGDFEEASYQIINSKYANQVGDRSKRNQVIMKTGKMFTKQSAKHFSA